jgi:hypothetical protein
MKKARVQAPLNGGQLLAALERVQFHAIPRSLAVS